MTFHEPHVLWALLVPAALLALDLARGRVRASAPAHPKILQAQAGARSLTMLPRSGSLNTALPRVRWRAWLGLALAVGALARPQWGRIDEPVFDQAREIVIALDLSRSMLTTDVKPSRLDRAKLLVTSLLERLQGERVGLIVFSGTAFLQSPLSSDYEVLNEFLPALTPDYLPEGGTNYRALLETATSAFGEGSGSDRYLIILSDGEATDDDWKSAAEGLSRHKIRVIGLGVGTAEGGLVPDGHGGLVKDERGAAVLSKLEPATLQQLANMTHGVYRDASSWIDLAQLVKSTVDTGAKGHFREERQARYDERFQWLLAPALGLLLWSFWAEFPVRPRPRAIRWNPAHVPPPLPPLSPRTASAAAAVALTCIWILNTATARAAVKIEPPPAHTSADVPAPPATVIPAPPPSAAETETEKKTSPAEPLTKLIQDFSQRPKLTAREYADLAQATIDYGERMKSAMQPPVHGAIEDGIAAVDAGQAADHGAADWEKLRGQLQEFLKPPEPTPTPPPQHQNSKDQKQQNSSSQNSDQDQKSQSPPKDSSSQNQPQDQSQKDSQKSPSPSSGANNNGQPKPPESAFGKFQDSPMPSPSPDKNSNPGETQKVGGAPEQKPEGPQDPTLIMPLQRLEQVKNQDSPAELQSLLRGHQPTQPSNGKNW